jgi:hypothetical protein
LDGIAWFTGFFCHPVLFSELPTLGQSIPCNYVQKTVVTTLFHVLSNHIFAASQSLERIVPKPSLPGLFRPGLSDPNRSLMFLLLNNYLVKKTTLVFPSSKELWEFFRLTDVREFHLDSFKCSVTGRFLAEDIEVAKEKLKARIEGEAEQTAL